MTLNNGDQSEPSPQRAPTLGDQMGLGPHFVPAPASWEWRRVEAPDGSPFHVLRIATVVGIVGVVFSDEALGKFIDQALERRVGLTVARNKIIDPRNPRGV